MLGELPEAGVQAPEELPPAAGLIPRILTHLFSQIVALQREPRLGRELSFSVSCALLEIYKEQVSSVLGGVRGAGGRAGGRWADSSPTPALDRCPPCNCTLVQCYSPLETPSDHGPGVGCRQDHAA